ncbi:Aspartyl/asparaginyl beta-hydroxylase [Larimichthys crocea]|uniref:Aspartyl/asparaginyl beta-hydroxylase n=1 Tax=Larimichthys crocea TaxID=215358 RepID=A0A6G0HJZ6_LARCR|nr:Aspartyl/asparaginyl beta-hydroxylase [Larimichthys crocea]
MRPKKGGKRELEGNASPKKGRKREAGEERVAKERADKERLERERVAKERLEKERITKERAEKERLEMERIAKERAEKERLERERIAKERAEKERLEKERIAKERAEKERLERERIAKERVEKERLEKERIAKERAEKERLERERIAKERAEKERLERERIAKERLEDESPKKDWRSRSKERLEMERITRERVEKERLEKERTEKEKERLERAAREKEEREKMQKERIAMERARISQEDRLENEKAAKEKAEKERLEKERAAREERERMVKERERIKQVRVVEERLEKDKAVREKELMERQRLAREKAVCDKIEAEKERNAAKVETKKQEPLERKPNASLPKVQMAQERNIAAVRREKSAVEEKMAVGLKEVEAPRVGDSPEEKTETSEPLAETTNQQAAEPPGAEPTEAEPSRTPAEETASVSESGPSPVHRSDEVSRSHDVESEIQAAVPLPALVEDNFVPDDPRDSAHPYEDQVHTIDTTGVLLEEPPPPEDSVESGQHLTSSRVTQEAGTVSEFRADKEEENLSEPPAEPEPQSETPREAETSPEAEGTAEKQAEEKLKEKAKKKKPKLLNKFDKTIKAEIDAAEKLRKKGKSEEALRAFETLVQQHPQSPRARYGKAQAEDDLAEKLRSNDMLQKAINTYREAAELPDVTSDLLRAALKRRAERQQFLGRMRGSLATLEKLTQNFPEDIGLKNELGVAHLLLGDNKGAKKVYEEVLAVAPSNGFAKVHYGFILKSENKIAESIPYLKEGLESGEPGTDDGRFYFHLGDALQRVGDNSAYHWYELGHRRGHFASVWQRSLYNVAGLKAQPWWTAKETGYIDLVKTLERNWKTIRDEALAVMDQNTGLFIPEDENLRERGEWGQYTLWQQGKKVGNSCQSVPKTCSLLDRYSEATGCKRGQVRREHLIQGQIKFSVMQPGTHVWPHTGPTNCRLRMHLGLVIPKHGCRIRCTDQTREWEEGKVLIFDDSFEHEVWQDADSYRLIFIVDVWHPELTAYQRQTLSPI